MDERISRSTKIMNKSHSTSSHLRKFPSLPRKYLFLVNQKTDLHEHLAYENKKNLTLTPLKSQVRLRLSRVRFLTGHFAWIFSYFLQMIFLANAVIWFISLTRKVTMHHLLPKCIFFSQNAWQKIVWRGRMKS